MIGKLVEARAYFDEAVEFCEKINDRPELALTHFDYARMLFEHFQAETNSARQHLEAAIIEFRRWACNPTWKRPWLYGQIRPARSKVFSSRWS